MVQGAVDVVINESSTPGRLWRDWELRSGR
jgi:hypothetical protein